VARRASTSADAHLPFRRPRAGVDVQSRRGRRLRSLLPLCPAPLAAPHGLCLFYTTKIIIVVNLQKKTLVTTIGADTHFFCSGINVYSGLIYLEPFISTLDA